MRLLLDTHVVLWQLSGARSLGEAAVEAIAKAEELYVSVVSFAEIGVKQAIGKLHVSADIYDGVLAHGLTVLPLTPRHGLGVAELPLHHRDPFDRLLVAQGLAEALTIVTSDDQIARYGVGVIAAAD